MITRRDFLKVTGAAAAAAALTACGGSSSTASSAASGTASSAASSAVAKLDKVKVAVPNDTTNEARALTLLEKNGFFKLKADAGLTATAKDIEENPLNVSVDEDEAARDRGRIVAGTVSKVGSGDENTFGGPLAGESAIEGLDLRPRDVALPSLRLHIHLVEAELVELRIEKGVERRTRLDDAGPAFGGIAHGQREPLPAGRRHGAEFGRVRRDEQGVRQKGAPLAAEFDQVVSVRAVTVQEDDELARRARFRRKARSVDGGGHDFS